MYNPNVPSSNMGIAPISGQPSQPMGPAPMAGPAPMGPMGPPPPMAPPMMGGMPPPPMMAPPPMAPPIAPITEGLGGFGGSSAGRAGFSERMQRMTAPPKPKPMPQPVQGMSYGGEVAEAALRYGRLPAMSSPYGMPQAPMAGNSFQSSFGMPQQGSVDALDQYGAYLDDQYGDPQFDEKRDNFLQGIAQQEQQTFGGLSNYQVGLPMANGGSVPRRTEISGQPHMLAYINPQEERLLRGLGGSGQPGPGGVPAYAREDGPGSDYFGTAASNYGYGSSGNSSDSSYEDEAYGDDGYGRVDYGGGDDSGGDGDDDDYYDYLDDDYVYVAPPAPAPPVVVPEPESGGDGDDIKDRVVADLVYSSADPTVGSSDPSVPDVAPDFATFTDSIDPYGSLTGQVVSPTVSAAPKAIDAVGAAPVVGSGEGKDTSTEVDVLGVNPISLSSSGITDRGKGMTVREMIAAGSGNPNNVVFDTSNIPAVDSDFTARRAGEILDSLNVARPGGSSKTRIEDAGLANAMAAAQGIDSGIRQNIADSFNNRSIRESEIGGRDDLARNQMLGGLLEMNTPEGEARMRASAYDPTSSLGLDPEPSEVRLEMAQPTDGGLLANTPGMQKFLQENPDFKAGDKAKPFFETFAPSTDTMDAMGRGMPATPYSDPYAGDIVKTDVRTDLGIGTPYFRVGDPIDETTQKMLNESPLKGAMLGEALTPSDVTFLNSPEMNILASTAPAQTVPAGTDSATTTTTTDTDKKDEKIAPTKPYAESDYKSPGVLDDYVDPYEDQYVKDSYSDQLFGDPPKAFQAFGSMLNILSGGLIDLNKITENQRKKGLEAFAQTNQLAYKNGVVVGVKDPEGRTILLGPQPPKEKDDTEGDDNCPPGFKRVEGVCVPTGRSRVAANPATAIEDAIASATLPSTLRPVVRDVVDDDDEEEETSDVGGLTIRRPNYFAGGGAVSEGMGSAIDSFISAMGGSVKKKSNVAPVGMTLGGFVGNETTKDYSDDNYTDPYEELERDYGYDPTDPFGDGDTSYGDDSPSDTVTADTFIGPMQPNVTYQPPVDTGGDETDPFVKNAILSARNYYNDGSVGPTMQNAAALPKQETFMQGISNYLPESVNSAFMLGPNYDQSVFGAAADMGGELATSFYDDVIGPEGKPLEYLGGAAVDLGRSVFDTLYDPPKAVYGAVDSVFDAFGRLGTETNARDRVGNIIGGPLAAATALLPFSKAAKVISSDVDAAQKSSAKKFNKSIEGTNFPSIGGFISPNNPKLNEKERNMINASLAEASAMDRRGFSPEEILSQTNVASLPIKDVAGNTVRNEMLYSFRPDEVNIDVSKLPTTGILGKAYSSIAGKDIPTVPLSKITSKSPLKNIGSDLLDTTNVGMQTQLAMTLKNLF